VKREEENNGGEPTARLFSKSELKKRSLRERLMMVRDERLVRLTREGREGGREGDER